MRVPQDTSVAGVTLRSADVERSRAFYREIAGLEDLGDGTLGWNQVPLVTVIADGVSGGRAPRSSTPRCATRIAASWAGRWCVSCRRAS